MKFAPMRAPLAVGLFTVVVCAATLSPASNADGYLVWRFCQHILEGIPYSESIWDHRTARSGVVLPTLVIQALFGSSLWAYYAVPTLATAAAAVGTFLLGRTLANDWVGALSALSLVLAPVMLLYSSSQLTPEPFSQAYLAFCLMYGVRYCRSGLLTDLVGCSLLFGCAYYAKVTNLFFGPGVVLTLLLLAPRRWMSLGVFSLINVLMFALETALFLAFTEQRLGRASVIMGNHLTDNPSVEETYDSFWQLLERYTSLPLDVALPLYLFIIACVWLATKNRRREVWWILLPTLCFFLFTMFAVRSIDPIKVVQPFRKRYLLPALGLQALAIWLWLEHLGVLHKVRQFAGRWNARQFRMMLLAAALSVTIAGHVVMRVRGRFAPIAEAPFRASVERALRQGTPMITPPGDRKTLPYVQAFLWDSYQPSNWQVSRLPNRRKVMLPIGVAQRAADPQAILSRWLGQTVVLTRYDYSYLAREITLLDEHIH